MTARTAQEVKAERERVMGRDLGGTYDILWQYTARLYSMWYEYRTLFGHSEERYDFLMGVAPDFFRVASVGEMVGENATGVMRGRRN